jgi:predicted secreted Zn-dependent protease
MRRSRRLLISAALMAVLILPASAVSAATTVTYQLSGTAAAALFPQVSMSGAAKAKPGRESGQWSATFNQDLGAILGGTFTLASRARTFEGAITGGTFGPGVGDCARTTIPVHGVVAGGGSFDVTLTRLGSLVNGSCVVSSSTVLGSATLIYP